MDDGNGTPCPGCGKLMYDYDFDGFTLEKHTSKFFCHVHSRKCEKYKGKKDPNVFWACVACNTSQFDKCGKWENGILVRTTCQRPPRHYKKRRCYECKEVYETSKRIAGRNQYFCASVCETKFMKAGGKSAVVLAEMDYKA